MAQPGSLGVVNQRRKVLNLIQRKVSNPLARQAIRNHAGTGLNASNTPKANLLTPAVRNPMARAR
jgi:hypothetical protein